MSPNPSLIPKTTLAQPSYQAKKPSFLAIGSIVIFFISAGLLGGAYFYKKFLENNIVELNNRLESIEADFEPSAINELVRASKAIENSKIILSKHKATSNIFELLEDLTLVNVRFSNFSFSGSEGKESDEYVISMNGEASSYTTVAEQAAVFENSDFIKNAAFSGFALKGATGNVSFNVVISINPDFIKYE
jgi:hypothetical protein